MEVAILGAGPSGILAAAKVIEMGHTVSVFSNRTPGKLLGAQYLHCPPPIIQVSEFDIDYKLTGTPEGYRNKVYGEQWNGEVSPVVIDEHSHGWDIREAYFNLLDMFKINEAQFSSYLDVLKLGLIDNYDFVFSSLPRPTWQVPGEEFKSQEVWAIGMGKDQDPIFPVPLNTVQCNGEEAPSWYRAANIDGWHTVEWPNHGESWRVKPIVPGVSKIKKPLERIPSPTAKNPADDHLIHIGRYGEWKKGILSSHAIEKVEEVLS